MCDKSLIREQTYWNANTIDTKVTQSKNSRAISNNTNTRIRMRPIPQNRLNALALLNANIQCLRLSIQRRILKTDIANGRCVDQWHELLDVVDEHAVEEVDVIGFEGREVQVLVDSGAAGVYHLHGARDLRGHGFHDVGDQAGEVLGDAVFWCEGGSCNE